MCLYSLLLSCSSPMSFAIEAVGSELQGLYFYLVPGGYSFLSLRGWAMESFLLVLPQAFSLCIYSSSSGCYL